MLAKYRRIFEYMTFMKVLLVPESLDGTSVEHFTESFLRDAVSLLKQGRVDDVSEMFNAIGVDTEEGIANGIVRANCRMAIESNYRKACWEISATASQRNGAHDLGGLVSEAERIKGTPDYF